MKNNDKNIKQQVFTGTYNITVQQWCTETIH